jgi:hypothetical protein
LAWHGLSLALPEDCGPVKIEGDGSKGAVLIADLKSPRIGLRWTTLGKRADPAKFVRGAMLAEIGKLATAEAVEHTPGDAFTHGLLYVEKDPPGRDVFVGFSKATRRVVEVVLHVRAVGEVDEKNPKQRRERELPLHMLSADLLPTLQDDASRTAWSIFDLRFTLPEAGWTLAKQRLNAGDLTMELTRKRHVLIVRQIGPARLALKRQEAKQWVTIHGLLWKQMYKSSGEGLGTRDEPKLLASVKLVRRRRFFFARWAPPVRYIAMHHDEARDRLVLIDADDASLIDKVLPTVGRREAA